MTTADRRAALVESLPEGVDAVLVTKLVNVRYLTGFTGSNGAVLVRRDGEPVFASDGRYEEQVAAEARDLQVRITRAPAADLVAAATAVSVRRLAIERHHVTLTAYDALCAAADGVDLVGAGELVENLRLRKDDDEITALSRACACTDAALTKTLPQLRPGVTEREIAWSLLAAMREAGADDAAFDSIVAFGPHSAIPHHQPTGRTLERGDLVKLDFGAKVDGYHADMTRTVVCGPAQDWQRELHAQVEDIQARCREQTVVGAVPVQLDTRAQQLVRETGHRLVHGLGHGVGLEIHEKPFVVPSSTDRPLAEQMTLTIEPGIYLPGRGGVRIEDTAVVRAGGAEPLTSSPRHLIEA